eukprot:4630415-Pleurochrysis_carterae.AAC.1
MSVNERVAMDGMSFCARLFARPRGTLPGLASLARPGSMQRRETRKHAKRFACSMRLRGSWPSRRQTAVGVLWFSDS